MLNRVPGSSLSTTHSNMVLKNGRADCPTGAAHRGHPKISKSIGHPVEIVLAKGQTHFVCRERAEAFFSDKLDKDSQEILKQIREGRCDRSRISPEIDSYIWNQINVREYNAGACGRCKDKFKCGYRKLRDSMLNTRGGFPLKQSWRKTNSTRAYKHVVWNALSIKNRMPD